MFAPSFSIVDGEYLDRGGCTFEEMETKKIGNVHHNLGDCERRKIFQYIKQLFRSKDSEKKLILNKN